MKIDTDKIVKLLEKVSILQDIKLDISQEIAKSMQVEKFQKGQFIVKRGNIGKRLYFIYSGKAEVQVSDQTGELRKKVILKRADVAGEISLLIQSTYSVDIVALNNTVALYLDSPKFMKLIKKFPEFSEVMSSLMTNRMAQNGGLNKVGKYQLLDKLGQGSMATVFRAYDTELDREVALKMLKYKLACDPVFLDRFEQEAKTIASLNHPNIVSVYEVIDEFSTRFIVMEKLQGQNIAEFLKKKGAFGIAETREILSQVSLALEYAHSQGEEGIVHRDIKPSNILVDHYGNIKLTDFGIAGPPQDKDINIEGTPSYVAPEIISGDPVDGRADIYSLGITAFQMLTNSLPFSSSSLKKLLKAQLKEEPPDIRFACLDIDESFASFIDKALSKKPDGRISDWQQIKSLLNPTLNKSEVVVGLGEVGVLVKFQETTNQKSTELIDSVRELLESKDVKHTIEVYRTNNSN